MRLLDLRNFDPDKSVLPPFYEREGQIDVKYAILSHRWRQEEILFEHVRRPRNSVRARRGYQKFIDAVRLAQRDHSFLWIDTCCINKDSSAELSEAINSMFQWYREAKTCIAYLDDTRDGLWTPEDDQNEPAGSEWFTRGWTLQELLAPAVVKFYAANWTFIGTKATLCAELSDLTGIPKHIMQGGDIFSESIAARMSWAARRVTTRVEDIAYCLLGIFDVNMPLLYGEGRKAFIRLQEELIKGTDDFTLFAWEMPDTTPCPWQEHGLLADEPSYFRGSSNYITHHDSQEPYAMTNKGLRIQLVIYNDDLAALPCSTRTSNILAVNVARIGDDQWARVSPSLHSPAQRDLGRCQTMYFPQGRVANKISPRIGLVMSLDSQQQYIAPGDMEFVPLAYSARSERFRGRPVRVRMNRMMLEDTTLELPRYLLGLECVVECYAHTRGFFALLIGSFVPGTISFVAARGLSKSLNSSLDLDEGPDIEHFQRQFEASTVDKSLGNVVRVFSFDKPPDYNGMAQVVRLNLDPLAMFEGTAFATRQSRVDVDVDGYLADLHTSELE